MNQELVGRYSRLSEEYDSNKERVFEKCMSIVTICESLSGLLQDPELDRKKISALVGAIKNHAEFLKGYTE